MKFVILSVLTFGVSVFAAEIDVGKLEKSCASGSAAACGDLSKSEYDIGKKDSAREHAKAGCDGDSMRGCTVLGILAASRFRWKFPRGIPGSWSGVITFRQPSGQARAA